MKKVKKSFGILVTVFAFCMAFAVTAKVDAAEVKVNSVAETNMDNLIAEPLVTDISKANFALGAYSSSVSSSNILRVGGYAPMDANYVDVALYDSSMNCLKTTRCSVSAYSGYTFMGYIDGLAKNKLYYVTARTVQVVNGQETVGNWTEKRAAIFLKSSAKGVRNYTKGTKTLKVKAPKIKGVKKYKIQISKKQDSGYKNVKTIKPGKNYTVTKYKGKALKTGVTYYVRVVPVISSGIGSDIVAIYPFL